MRFKSQPVRPIAGVKPARLASVKFAEGTINNGMITMVEAANLPPGALQVATNATVRFDRTARRPGTVLLAPVKPDGSPVLRIAFIKRNDGTAYTIRMTPIGIHSLGADDWNAYTSVDGLHGTINDRLQSAVVLNDFVFANNGADYIQKVDFLAQTYSRLGNAPKYRYVTGFFNRVVGAARRDENEVEVGWSGDANINEWDPIIDESAGSSPIVDSPADLSDFITGIFGFTNVMVVLREKSIWLATKQPITTNPFNFYCAIPGIGCDSPYSAAVLQNGIAWLDRRTATVWAYAPGGEPEAIGRPIERTLLDGLDDPSLIFASYSPTTNEYSVCIPQVGSSIVLVWTYNFRTKAWTRNEYYAVCCIDDAELATAGTTIEQLLGTIDDLVGTIESLSPTNSKIASRSFGRTDGEILLEDESADTDGGRVYETVLGSKAFILPEFNSLVAQIRFEYIMLQLGSFKLQYSKDGGATEDSWRDAKSVTPTKLNKPLLFTFNDPINTRRIAWRIVGSSGRWELLNYEVHIYPSGDSRP